MICCVTRRSPAAFSLHAWFHLLGPADSSAVCTAHRSARSVGVARGCALRWVMLDRFGATAIMRSGRSG
jgi:hypothetical protein